MPRVEIENKSVIRVSFRRGLLDPILHIKTNFDGSFDFQLERETPVSNSLNHYDSLQDKWSSYDELLQLWFRPNWKEFVENKIKRLWNLETFWPLLCKQTDIQLLNEDMFKTGHTSETFRNIEETFFLLGYEYFPKQKITKFAVLDENGTRHEFYLQDIPSK